MLTAVTVRQLNCYIKSLLDGDVRLNRIAVTGEISNFKHHYASGHWYFSLKDDAATVRCVMFRGEAGKVPFPVADGMLVTVTGQVTVYERDGQYQIYVHGMERAGVGALAERFEQLKQKLSAEGLIDPESRRPLPKFPKQIAVLTSETGAALQDILNISARRFPLCEILLCPVCVQGERAVPEMLDALDRVYRLGTADVIIIGRGGGSAEDLWAYNDESLARKIFESPVPVVSAVGHETDFSIADFVADLRAPTPSAAAELCLPDARESALHIAQLGVRLNRALNRNAEDCKNRLRACLQSPCFADPRTFLEPRILQNDRLQERLLAAQKERLSGNAARFSNAVSRMDALSPLKTMLRGFAAVSKENMPVHSARQIQPEDTVRLRFADGTADCSVKEIHCE